MRILVTAGVTQVPIDQVRVITSIFSGRTGTRIALEANRRGFDVTLLTSAPQLVGEQLRSQAAWHVRTFRTFDDLYQLLAALIPAGQFDVIIHTAAISDYQVANVYARSSVPSSDTAELRTTITPGPPGQADAAVQQPAGSGISHWEVWPDTALHGKIPSTYSELWLRLVPTPKLVDYFRRAWGFRGILVKFKLEAGVPENVLLERAEESRQRSEADLMVANLLENVSTTAWLGPIDGAYRRLSRHQLAPALLDAIATLAAKKA